MTSSRPVTTLATGVARVLETVFAPVLAAMLVVVAIGAPDVPALLLGVAAVLVAGALGARYSARTLDAARSTVGVRAEAHRQLVDATPAPRHPRTAGRPSPRAPSGAIAIA